MKQLAKNGLRYPIAPYGIQSRRARRHGRVLREEIGLRKRAKPSLRAKPKQSMLPYERWIASLRSQ